MKKPISCILIFLFLFATSACNEKVPDKINTHIDASYKAEFGDMYFEGLMILSPEGQMYLDMSTPDELYGLSFSWDKDFTIGYRGLNATTEDGYLPDTSFAQTIKEVCYDICTANPVFVKAENGMYLTKGKAQGKEYIVYTDNEGNIITISVPDAELKLSFDYNNL